MNEPSSPAAQSGQIIVIRPGALGDVLVSRGLLRYFQATVRDATVVLVAPGEQGRFLCRPGWADRVVDWDAAWLSRLFADGPGEEPEQLRTLFAAPSLVLAYTGTRSDTRLAERIGRLTSAPVREYPAQPPKECGSQAIDAWLVEKAALAVGETVSERALPEEAESQAFLSERIPLPFPFLLPFSSSRRYLVMHPGSGSSRKNWPVESFAVLGKWALETKLVDEIVITAGPADADVARPLAASLPGAYLAKNLPLERLGSLLAHASLYVGNDSGVSHLSAAVRPEAPDGGPGPVRFVLFGPTNPSVWCPRGAIPIQSPGGMEDLRPEAVIRAVTACLLQKRSEETCVGNTKIPEQMS